MILGAAALEYNGKLRSLENVAKLSSFHTHHYRAWKRKLTSRVVQLVEMLQRFNKTFTYR